MTPRLILREVFAYLLICSRRFYSTTTLVLIIKKINLNVLIFPGYNPVRLNSTTGPSTCGTRSSATNSGSGRRGWAASASGTSRSTRETSPKESSTNETSKRRTCERTEVSQTRTLTTRTSPNGKMVSFPRQVSTGRGRGKILW